MNHCNSSPSVSSAVTEHWSANQIGTASKMRHIRCDVLQAVAEQTFPGFVGRNSQLLKFRVNVVLFFSAQ